MLEYQYESGIYRVTEDHKVYQVLKLLKKEFQDIVIEKNVYNELPTCIKILMKRKETIIKRVRDDTNNNDANKQTRDE